MCNAFWTGQLNGCVHYMKVRMKIVFKLALKRKVVTSLLKYNCLDYFFQVLIVKINVRILL